MLIDVVQPLVKNLMFGFGSSEEHEDDRAEQGEWDRAEQNDERIAKAVELRREDEKDEDEGKAERGEELVALDAQLARLTCVINRVTLRQNPGGLFFQYL